MRAAVTLLVASVLLAGCGSPSPGPEKIGTSSDSSSSATETTGPASRPDGQELPQAALYDCTYFTTNFFGMAEEIQARLPQGLTAEEAAPGIGGVLIETYTCASIVLDNATVIHEASLAFTLVQVEASDALEREGAFHSFVIEAFASDATLALLLSNAGTPTRQADITVEIGPVAQAEIRSSDGTVAYGWTATGGGGQSDGEFTRRIFNTPASWMDMDYSWHWEGLNREAVIIEAEGSIVPLLVGPGIGRGAPGDFDGRIVWSAP